MQCFVFIKKAVHKERRPKQIKISERLKTIHGKGQKKQKRRKVEDHIWKKGQKYQNKRKAEDHI